MDNSKPGAGDAAKAGQTSFGPEPILDRTFRFAVEIVKLGLELDRSGNVGRVLAAQVLRSGTAVGSQVEEAQAAESKADFVSKMAVGLKESREVHYRLRVLAAAGLGTDGTIDRLTQEADEIRRILAQIIVNTKRGRAASPAMRSRAP
jgi:four helix bundle protein